MIVYALIAFGALWALWDKTLGRLSVKIWPNMEDWGASSNANEKDVLLPIIRPGNRWCAGHSPQQKDDYYEVDMQKDRTISKVELVCKGRDPLRYKIEIAKDEAPDNFHEIGILNRPISYKFDPAEKFRIIKFTIVEPEVLPDNQWHSFCIYEVRFWESRFWGRFKCRIKSRSH